MPDKRKEESVKLDLNSEVFQQSWLALDKTERNRVTDTLRKVRKLNWNEVYRDQGLKWEKISSVRPPAGIDALYSLRITQSRRATAYRHGSFMRLLSIEPEHDSAYGKR